MYPLAERSSPGLSVELWHVSGESWLVVRDSYGEHRVNIPRGQELEAFNHPYVYVGSVLQEAHSVRSDVLAALGWS